MKQLLFLLPLLFLLVFPQSLFAQTAGTGSSVLTASPTPAEITYTLPYPGLLPDNPLYIFKVLRDRLISFFISDPLKRSSFDLLQADKRLQGAYYLQEKGSSYDSLVGSTVSKAENYFEEAIGSLQQAQSIGEDVPSQADMMQTALLKHQEIITGMKQRASSHLQEDLRKELSRLANFEKTLHGLSRQ